MIDDLESSALCVLRASGGSYPEMKAKAIGYAAKFFDADPDDLIVVDPPIAHVRRLAAFSQDPLEPEIWEAEFKVGLVGSLWQRPPKDEDDDED